MTDPIVYPAASKPSHQIRPDLLGTVIPAEHGTLVRWAIKANQPETPLHSHIEFEQITVLLEGRIRTSVGEETFILYPGDVLRIDRGAMHGATTALDDRDAIVLDIFMPPRQQYLDAARNGARFMTDIAPESARNFRFVGYSDMGGKADGTQVMLNKGHAYVCNPFSTGTTVLDVSDPRAPKVVNFLPVNKRSWALHLQSAGDLLLVCEEFNFYSIFNEGAASYYDASVDVMDSKRFGKRGEDYSAGLRVYDIKDPANPRAIGFLEVEGLGLHRAWWTGGRYAYASAFLDGFTDHILIVIDMADPARPRECGRWWLPGMNKAAGETADWTGRVALHHAIVADGTAYAAWRDGGFTSLDVSDPGSIKLITERNWSPPFAGGTHTCLPLVDRNLLVVADEAVRDIDVEGIKPTWIFDIRVPENPVSIATVPIPNDQDYIKKGGHFGPHNLWENRPDAYRSSRYLFETFQNAGLRVFDLKDPFRPEEIGYFVPPPPKFGIAGPAPQVLHSADLYVAPNGLVYITDFNAGLYIAEWTGDAAVF